MIIDILKISNIMLCSVGIFFILVDLKAKFDRSFLHFGISTIALCIFTSVDLWIIPYAKLKNNETLALISVQFSHILISAFYLPFFFLYMKSLLKQPTKDVRIWIAISWIISLLFFWDEAFLVVEPSTYDVIGTSFYNFIISPYFFAAMGYCIYLSLKGYFSFKGIHRRIFLSHLIGTLSLFIFGSLDLLFVMGFSTFGIISYTSFGLIIYGILTTYSFLERFMLIIHERDSLSKNLAKAYQEATEGQSFKQIGESTARINHELKNHLAIIQNNIPRIKRYFKENNIKTNTESIENAAQRMGVLCDNILELSQKQDLSNTPSIVIQQSIEECLSKNFPQQRGIFRILASNAPVHIQIEPEKWEQVLLNLLKNALEANATRVLLEVNTLNNRVVLSIRDNGEGVRPQDVPQLFQAFFTTKRSTGGSGLGLSIVKNLLENLGGWSNAYCRVPRGVEINVILPIPQQGNPHLYARSPRKKRLILWADSASIMQEVRIKCQSLKIPLDIFPLSQIKTIQENLNSDSCLYIYLIEKNIDASTSIPIQINNAQEYHLEYINQSLYADKDPFSEGFLANAWDE